jgi:hypothetical protein
MIASVGAMIARRANSHAIHAIHRISSQKCSVCQPGDLCQGPDVIPTPPASMAGVIAALGESGRSRGAGQTDTLPANMIR